MDRTGTRRVAVLAAVAGMIFIGATAQASGAAGGDAKRAQTPRPPHLPQNFRGQGEWIVRDLGITVPFSWRGNDGNSRMVAGGPDYPIWFTNLIWHNSLYTLTYKWPNVTDHPCDKIPGFFNLHLLNQGFKTARFVGREILQGRPNRHVNHWRAGVVLPQLPPGNFPALALRSATSTSTRQSQHLLAGAAVRRPEPLRPRLDEWLRMDTFRHKPGRVGLPGTVPAARVGRGGLWFR